MKALIIGANSAIGSAFMHQWLQASTQNTCIAVSRLPPAQLLPGGSQWQSCDYSEAGIIDCCEELSEAGPFERVVICNGQLHSDELAPEKRLEELSLSAMTKIMTSNTMIPALFVARLLPLLDKKAVVAVLSARVGSIGDNRLGGWYSYRASKAALNMMLQTAAVEYARRKPGAKLMAFHPGTTDSPLSRPFQTNVPEGKLFTPEFVAMQLHKLMSGQQADGKLSFIDWEGKTIPW
ncbi:SDR family NAD(P)-dependent oxidoreductase [Shewanella corallii]|uniref:SDR family NAD(P)-dependent oxidoreductase n=1 Tax=Shewanella corallii TaxID=560080 RepID=A0ABT0N576_9GAMM|nr:SDR family NAD(P)-dependent oxidoreductase [Shewanella corallii]MCL2913601.1 SDR family NAD(P)-dependent oxidoreductase [Shewanella corallii]